LQIAFAGLFIPAPTRRDSKQFQPDQGGVAKRGPGFLLAMSFWGFK
jgi:hypothetical protein